MSSTPAQAASEGPTHFNPKFDIDSENQKRVLEQREEMCKLQHILIAEVTCR